MSEESREALEFARAVATEGREALAAAKREERRLLRAHGDTLGVVYVSHGEDWMDEEQRDWEEGRDEDET